MECTGLGCGISVAWGAGVVTGPGSEWPGEAGR
jgi:hypothetical protein